MIINLKVIVFFFAIFFFCRTLSLAQSAIHIQPKDLKLQTSSNQITENEFLPQHVSHLFLSKEYCDSLIENTRVRRPAVYQSMLDTNISKPPHTPVVGDRTTFFVTNFQLQNYEQITAELRATSSKVNIYVELNELDSGHVRPEFLDSLILYLTQQVPRIGDNTEGILTLEQNLFGNPPDKDKDGILDIIIYDIQDGYTGKNGNNGYISGYFSAVDQTNGLASNKRDLIYLDSYPTMYPSREMSLFDALQSAAHNYQHLIHYNYDPDETFFINEGCSMGAEYMCGFLRKDVNKFFANTDVPLMRKDTTQRISVEDLTRAQYFILYLDSQFGTSLFKYLVQDSLHGLDGVTSALKKAGHTDTAMDLFETWCVANQVQNSSIAPKYGYGGTSSLDSKPTPRRIHNTDQVNNTNDTINPMAAVYISLRNVGYFDALFYGSPSLKLYATASINVQKLKTDSVALITGIYSEIVFVVINTSPDSVLHFQYSTWSRSDSVEIFYDTGKPDTLVIDGKKNAYMMVDNSVVHGGAGFALAFLPPSNSTLVQAKYFVGFGQEIPGSSVPPDAPRSFVAHVWQRYKQLPGIQLFNLFEGKRYTVDRNITPINTWYAIPLTSSSVWLTNLKDTVYVGYTDDDNYATAIGLTQLPGPPSHSYFFTGSSWTPSGGVEKNKWYSFNDLTWGPPSSSVSLNTWEIMIRTMWQQPINPVSDETQPSSISLKQNYPNPFGHNTAIQFVLSEQAVVSLKIYDLLCREVSELVHGTYDSGLFTTSWEGRNDAGQALPNGMYFYRLQVGEKILTKKMILAR